MRIFALCFVILSLCVGCSDSDPVADENPEVNDTLPYVEQRWQEVLTLEDGILDSSLVASPQQSQDLLLKSAAFANDFPNEARAARSLMMTVRAAQGLQEWRVAVEYLDRIIENYPHFEGREQCYYLKGFLLDHHVQDRHQALAAYNVYLEKYPNSVQAAQIQERMGSMGLSDEELIRLFEEKNQQLEDSAGAPVYGT